MTTLGTGTRASNIQDGEDVDVLRSPDWAKAVLTSNPDYKSLILKSFDSSMFRVVFDEFMLRSFLNIIFESFFNHLMVFENLCNLVLQKSLKIMFSGLELGSF